MTEKSRHPRVLEHTGADTQSLAFQRDGVAVVLNRGQVFVIDRKKNWGLGAPPPRPANADRYHMFKSNERLPRAPAVYGPREVAPPRGKRKPRV